MLLVRPDPRNVVGGTTARPGLPQIAESRTDEAVSAAPDPAATAERPSRTGLDAIGAMYPALVPWAIAVPPSDRTSSDCHLACANYAELRKQMLQRDGGLDWPSAPISAPFASVPSGPLTNHKLLDQLLKEQDSLIP
jgi:hypothetical protein